MALTINTNISSLIAQRNLNSATSAMNRSIERMTTGYKINHAADNAAGYSIANMWKTQLGSLDVAADNAANHYSFIPLLPLIFPIYRTNKELCDNPCPRPGHHSSNRPAFPWHPCCPYPLPGQTSSLPLRNPG